MLVSLALSLMVPEASACGGFFCNNIVPVEQAGEVVVFEVDPEDGDAGTTTMHVQVTYQGPPIEFAWVVPVKGTPDLFVSNDFLFQALDQITRPVFYTLSEAEGECMLWDFALDTMDADVLPAPPNAEGNEGVIVLSQETVGPYETVVLAAESETDLIEWLQANSYNVPDGMGTTLAPYVADNHNFVALRLSSGEETGDLVPLGLRYEGTQPAIPIQLTSVAATDDMQLITYVLGPDRAVPENYLHVELNESAINWFTGGDNYQDVLSRAANQAGGHAFATEYSGTTDRFQNTFYQEAWASLDLGSSSGPMEFVRRVTQSGLPASATLLEVLETHVPVPDGYIARDVYNCPDCYPELDEAITDFNAVDAGLAIEEGIIAPLESINAMFERAPHITRLGSTMSASEMTVDPVFTFNSEMEQDVSNVHEARLVYQCDEATSEDTWFTAPKDLVLTDGTVIRIPSVEVLQERGLTEADFLNGLLEPAAATISSVSAEGQPELLYDGSVEIQANIERLNEEAEIFAGNGCNTATGGAGIWLLGLLPLLLRRR